MSKKQQTTKTRKSLVFKTKQKTEHNPSYSTHKSLKLVEENTQIKYTNTHTMKKKKERKKTTMKWINHICNFILPLCLIFILLLYYI